MVECSEYPRKTGFFYWKELECLAKALGFQQDLFSRNFPKELSKSSSDSHGLTTQQLLELIGGKHSYLHKAVDKTVNIHQQCWNLAAITKCLVLLDRRQITFAAVQSIRISYQFYESFSGRGLPVDDSLLLSAIKMSGHMISPLKMAHRLKHMSLEDSDYLQLHEFLDLLLWCEPYDTSVAGDISQVTDRGKDDQGYYTMANFDTLLCHIDQRISATLDDRYRCEELSFTRQKHASRFLSKDVLPVNRTAREDQVRRAKSQHLALRKALKLSQDRVRHTRIGYFLEKPFSVVELDRSQQVMQTKTQVLASTVDLVSGAKPDTAVTAGGGAVTVGQCSLTTVAVTPTVLDLVRPWVRPHTTSAVGDRRAVRDFDNRRPCISSVSRDSGRNVPPLIVSKHDRVMTSCLFDSAQFNCETAESKYERILQQNIQQHLASSYISN